jgi:hypothetical protein
MPSPRREVDGGTLLLIIFVLGLWAILVMGCSRDPREVEAEYRIKEAVRDCRPKGDHFDYVRDTFNHDLFAYTVWKCTKVTKAVGEDTIVAIYRIKQVNNNVILEIE